MQVNGNTVLNILIQLIMNAKIFKIPVQKPQLNSGFSKVTKKIWTWNIKQWKTENGKMGEKHMT